MATVTIKNIPDDLYAALKSVAARHHRSINSEIITCLDRTLRTRRVDPDTVLSEIAVIQKRLSLPLLTDDFIKKAKEEGRA